MIVRIIKKKISLTDLLSFVISAKFNNYFIDQNKISSYTSHMAKKSAIKKKEEFQNRRLLTKQEKVDIKKL